MFEGWGGEPPGGSIINGRLVGIGIFCEVKVSVPVGTMCADDELSITVAVTILEDIDDNRSGNFRPDLRHSGERFGV